MEDDNLQRSIASLAIRLSSNYFTSKKDSERLNINTALSLLSIAMQSGSPEAADKLVSQARKISRRNL